MFRTTDDTHPRRLARSGQPLIYTFDGNWSVAESFYFCVMTLTTIGYGDFTPSGPVMQLYTAVYAILGIGFFVAFNAKADPSHPA